MPSTLLNTWKESKQFWDYREKRQSVKIPQTRYRLSGMNWNGHGWIALVLHSTLLSKMPLKKQTSIILVVKSRNHVSYFNQSPSANGHLVKNPYEESEWKNIQSDTRWFEPLELHIGYDSKTFDADACTSCLKSNWKISRNIWTNYRGFAAHQTCDWNTVEKTPFSSLLIPTISPTKIQMILFVLVERDSTLNSSITTMLGTLLMIDT